METITEAKELGNLSKELTEKVIDRRALLKNEEVQLADAVKKTPGYGSLARKLVKLRQKISHYEEAAINTMSISKSLSGQ